MIVYTSCCRTIYQLPLSLFLGLRLRYKNGGEFARGRRKKYKNVYKSIYWIKPLCFVLNVDIYEEYGDFFFFLSDKKRNSGSLTLWICFVLFVFSLYASPGHPQWFSNIRTTTAGRRRRARSLISYRRSPTGKQYISRYINRTYCATLRTGRKKISYDRNILRAPNLAKRR